MLKCIHSKYIDIQKYIRVCMYRYKIFRNIKFLFILFHTFKEHGIVARHVPYLLALFLVSLLKFYSANLSAMCSQRSSGKSSESK